ncbi:hypothetical protein, partial [Candidatus Accumulibacter vicinus]|uniref:hypothetical protein n=1 Tax=Candidatus Accumulibacter vicinus TaxID=2954382 RepID=UPI00235B5E4B
MIRHLLDVEDGDGDISPPSRKVRDGGGLRRVEGGRGVDRAAAFTGPPAGRGGVFSRMARPFLRSVRSRGRLAPRWR